MVKSGEEGSSLTRQVRSMVKLLPTSNREDKATSARVEPRKKNEIEHEFTRIRKNEGMNLIMKALIEESTRESLNRSREGL